MLPPYQDDRTSWPRRPEKSPEKKSPEGDEEEMLPPYQDDHTALLRRPEKCPEKSPQGAGASRQSKTTSRTYTDPEGNVITEVCMMSR